MNEKYKRRIPKVLPVGIAMGILFSASPLPSPLTENKVKADVDTAATIITTFGKIYDAFLAEPFGKWLEEMDAKNSYAARLENVAYKAPTFQKGEFGISAFDFYKDNNFSKKVKIAYANGKVEYKTIKHGEQLRIKQAETVVDLTPDEPNMFEHNIIRITQKHLDEGNAGISLTNFKTYYLKSDNSGGKNVLADRFERQAFPGYFLNSGLRDIRYVNEDLFSRLPEEKRVLATITSKPVDKNDLFDFENLRNTNTLDVLTQHKEGKYSSIWVSIKKGEEFLQDDNDGNLSISDKKTPYPAKFSIIPIKKGSNKVFIKGFVSFIPAEAGSPVGNNICSEAVWTLHDTGKNGTFVLQNEKGQYLTVDGSSVNFTDDDTKASIFHANVSEDRWNNWLIDWYPGKENEDKRYNGIKIVTDEKDPNIQTALDSSGDVITDSWIEYAGARHYAGPDGVLVKGRWLDIEGKTYYFGSNGAFLRGYVHPDIDGKQYNFDDQGVLQRSTWVNKKYSDHNGAFVKEGLREIDGKFYCFKDYEVTNELRLEDQHIILHCSDKGVLEKASMLNGEAISGDGIHFTLEGKKYYVNQNGDVLPTGWDGRYYRNDKGERVSGLQEIDGKKYYFADNGELRINSTFKYYTDENGVTKPNFKGIAGVYSYLPNGSVSSWHYIETDDSGRITFEQRRDV